MYINWVIKTKIHILQGYFKKSLKYEQNADAFLYIFALLGRYKA